MAVGLIAALLVTGALAWGQKEDLTPTQPTPTLGAQAGRTRKVEIPLRISASQLEADQEKHLITFSGQVKAEYGDSVLYADKLLVYYQSPKEARLARPEGSKGPGVSPLGELGGERLDRLEARGNVRFVQGDRVAAAEQAVYHRQQDEIVLLGRPQVWRGENHLKGSRITFRLASRKVVVEGSPQQRVEAYLYQGAEKLKTTRESVAPGVPQAPSPAANRGQ
ncbi:MAG: LptA/OstA family protein [Desulfobaccales bacterium]